MKKFFNGLVFFLWVVSAAIAGRVIFEETGSFLTGLIVTLLVYGFFSLAQLYRLRYKQQRDLLFKTIETLEVVSAEVYKLANIVKTIGCGRK